MFWTLLISITVYRFTSVYYLQSPIVFRSLWVRRVKEIKKTPPSIKKPVILPSPTPVKQSLVPFPKYLTDNGAKNREKALAYLSKYYTGDELTAADNILKKEAGYRTDAVNEIGACGIVQANPCSKLNCPLNDSGLECQLQFFVGYINTHGYGTPLVAWNFHLKNNWY